MTNFIWITTQKELIHKYPQAPEEVSFLRNEHRHIFKFKIWLEVFSDDREVEFIIFKRFVNKLLEGFDYIENKSCEMLSKTLYNKIIYAYPKRDIQIEISEDGENGSLYYYKK